MGFVDFFCDLLGFDGSGTEFAYLCWDCAVLFQDHGLLSDWYDAKPHGKHTTCDYCKEETFCYLCDVIQWPE